MSGPDSGSAVLIFRTESYVPSSDLCGTSMSSSEKVRVKENLCQAVQEFLCAGSSELVTGGSVQHSHVYVSAGEAEIQRAPYPGLPQHAPGFLRALQGREHWQGRRRRLRDVHWTEGNADHQETRFSSFGRLPFLFLLFLFVVVGLGNAWPQC